MDLIRWESFLPLDVLFGNEPLSQAVAGWDLATDVCDEGDKIVIEIQLPGIEPDKYEIKTEDGVLVVSGYRDKSFETSDQNMFRREIQRGSFERRIPLPESKYDLTKLTAGLRNGVLRISLPKINQ